MMQPETTTWQGGDGAVLGDPRVLEALVRRTADAPALGVLTLDSPELGLNELLGDRLAECGCRVWQPSIDSDGGDPDWSGELDQRFDRIVSAYLLHEVDLDTKVALCRCLADEQLMPDGRIVIGDLAFSSADERAAAIEAVETQPWVADEALPALAAAGLAGHYDQVTPAGGVFVLWRQARQPTASRRRRRQRSRSRPALAGV